MDTMSARAWRWGGLVSVGVLDQGVISGANFVINVLLARWLPPAQYGGFAVCFSVLLLLAGPHSALITDPLTVVGPRRFISSIPGYLRGLLVIHAWLTVPVALCVAAAAFVPLPFVHVPSEWLLALALSLPLVLLLWLLRTACYLQMRPATALIGSGMYAAASVGLLLVAHDRPWFTAPAALAVMAAASALACVYMAASLGVPATAALSPALGTVAREHWTYGRWMLGAAVAHAVAYGLYLPLVGSIGGLDQAAALRALQNLALPLQQVLTGVSMVAFPALSRGVADTGSRYLRSRGSLYVLGGVGIAAAYGLVIALFGQQILTAVYASGFYAGLASTVTLIAVSGVVAALAQNLGILLRAINQPRAIFWSKMWAAAWLALAGVALVRASGVRGAILGLAGGSLAEAVVLVVVLVRHADGASTR